MSWRVRIWFKGLRKDGTRIWYGPPQEVRLGDHLERDDIYVHCAQDGWTYVLSRKRSIVRYPAALERYSVEAV